jgi:hypothetical protein
MVQTMMDLAMVARSSGVFVQEGLDLAMMGGFIL